MKVDKARGVVYNLTAGATRGNGGPDMKRYRAFALLLALILCALLALSSCSKLSKKDIEKDVAGQIAESARASGDGVGASFSILDPIKAARSKGTVTVALANEKLGVTLSSIGICGANIRDAHKAEMWDRILGIVKPHPEVLRAYAFCYDEARHTACFVVVVNPDVRDKKAQISLLRKELCAVFPGTDFVIETALEA